MACLKCLNGFKEICNMLEHAVNNGGVASEVSYTNAKDPEQWSVKCIMY